MATESNGRSVIVTRHAAERAAERFEIKGDVSQAIARVLHEAEVCAKGRSNGTLVYRHPEAWLIVAPRANVDVVVTVLPAEWPLDAGAGFTGPSGATPRASGAQVERLAAALAAKGMRVSRAVRTLDSPNARDASKKSRYPRWLEPTVTTNPPAELRQVEPGAPAG